MLNFIIAFISGPEIFIVLLIVLLLFGAKKIPEIARGLGKGMNEFRRATEDIKREMNSSTDEIDKDFKDISNKINE